MKFRPGKLGLLFFLLFLLDRGIKHFLIAYPPGSVVAVVIPKIFSIRIVFNTGIAFGLLRNHPLALTIINITIIFFLLVYTLGIKESRLKFWLILILIGAISNVMDRFIYGGILDYLDFSFWPTFNLADCYITTGIAGIIINAGFKKVKRV